MFNQLMTDIQELKAEADQLEKDNLTKATDKLTKATNKHSCGVPQERDRPGPPAEISMRLERML
ncbi:hypothetical protein FOPG_15203 [Fusarium oxysporum f. sp. conglutinans race 2 54008]|uniref:Uncharacterized protein n=1 Tax=Fusarium oxysporum f. sp. conglutinans race 2 54008 TaxID=1089457 RepID=X0I665_FUSOX|nr:hypothetical protein FOPG_15203 [Fusarium oxysporum f. sp. conglutinans race 2 54008]